MTNEKPSGKKKAATKGRSTKKSNAPSSTDELPPMASRLFMEQAMGLMFGGGEHVSGPAYKAQQLAYDAMEAAESGKLERAVALAKQALDLDPVCVDALMLMSQAASESLVELIENMRRTVETGERALGKEFFDENAGHFWGMLETRPYMRARSFLAQCLAETGHRDEAIEHYESLLKLNPNDNQGLRYCLMGLYLEEGHLNRVAGLFDQFEDEGSAIFAWARVLERFMAGDVRAATAAIGEAREANRHVEPLLTGKKRMPRSLPGYYGVGDENEAVVCVDTIGAAWKRAGGALAWLTKQG